MSSSFQEPILPHETVTHVPGLFCYLCARSIPGVALRRPPRRTAREVNARDLYEKTYCARGDLENRIKEQQLALFADRTSSSTMKANQLRLWFSTVAYLLIHQLRRLGLKATPLARAQCGTIRLKLLKIGAVVKITVRRIFISLASGYPYQQTFIQANENLQRAGPLPAPA